jgi:hypothetical protein
MPIPTIKITNRIDTASMTPPLSKAGYRERFRPREMDHHQGGDDRDSRCYHPSRVDTLCNRTLFLDQRFGENEVKLLISLVSAEGPEPSTP